MYLAGGWLTKYIEGTMPLPNSGPIEQLELEQTIH